MTVYRGIPFAAPSLTDGQAPRPQPGAGAARDGQPGRGMFIGMRGGPGGTKENDPAKVAELSEKYSTIWAAVAGIVPAAFGFQ